MSSVQENTYHLELYGIHYSDWEINFGSFTNHSKILVENYISDACSTLDFSEATDIHKFIYPHHIRKIYFIEGIAEGQITFAASGATSTLYGYRATICKVHEDGTENELFSTGWIVVDDTFAWDAVYEVGEEIVYHFWIDCWEKAKLTEYERIYLKIETDTSTCTDSSCSDCVLWHSNDATYEDVKIDIPLKF